MTSAEIEKLCRQYEFGDPLLKQVVEKLPDDRRYPFMLKLMGYTQKEIGQMLGLAQNTIHYRLKVAREYIQPRYIVLECDQELSRIAKRITRGRVDTDDLKSHMIVSIIEAGSQEKGEALALAQARGISYVRDQIKYQNRFLPHDKL